MQDEDETGLQSGSMGSRLRNGGVTAPLTEMRKRELLVCGGRKSHKFCYVCSWLDK
jgi:hypothetical protein